MTRIVGVHGVGNHRPGETPEQAGQHLSDIWRRHLSANTPWIRDVEVAYYADELRSPGRQGSDDLAGLSGEAELMTRIWLEQFGLPDGVRQGWGTWPLRQALAWLSERRGLSPRMVELFVSAFFSEVSTYLGQTGASARTKARNRVVEAVRRQRPTIVIAHSLGSVVAYEALWVCQDVPVELLVTLGSPLALPHAVFPRLDPSPTETRGARPPSVATWVNLADPGDLVALPPKGVSRRFTGVDADQHDVVHAFDFHLASNYLSCTRLATVLHEHR